MKRKILTVLVLAFVTVGSLSAGMEFYLRPSFIVTYDTNVFSDPLPHYTVQTGLIQRTGLGLFLDNDVFFSESGKAGLSISFLYGHPVRTEAWIENEGKIGDDNNDGMWVFEAAPSLYFATGPMFRAQLGGVDIGIALRLSIGSINLFKDSFNLGLQAEPYVMIPLGSERWKLNVGFLYDALSSYGLQNTKIFIWDHNRDGLYRRMHDSLRNSAGHISGAAYHWYSGAFYENVRRCREEFPDMDLLFTEGCIEKPAAHDAWYPGERYAHNIINDLNSGCNGWIDWNIVLDSKGGPNHAGGACDAPVIIDEDGDIRFHSSYYAISHFSRFIRRGARILGTELVSGRIPSAPDGVAADLIEATAAENPDGTIALVLLNRTDDEISLSIKLKGTEASSTCPAHAMQTMIFHPMHAIF